MDVRAMHRAWVRNAIPLPLTPVPDGRTIHLPGRGPTYVTDTPGPPGAPTLLLLHAVACTGLLTWFRAIPELARSYRVVTLDQRGHGQGIASERFSLRDCADDAAALIVELGLEEVIVVGYSMGSVIAQRTWRQHPRLVSGLVLAASTDRFRASAAERAFFGLLALSTTAARAVPRPCRAGGTARAVAPPLDSDAAVDLHDWALAEFRRTRPWAVAEALAALGGHHSRPWLHRIDVPTAVVVTARDRLVPPGRQRALAARIPGATTHEADTGHAGCVLEAEAFVPALVEGCASVAARLLDRERPERRLQL